EEQERPPDVPPARIAPGARDRSPEYPTGRPRAPARAERVRPKIALARATTLAVATATRDTEKSVAPTTERGEIPSRSKCERDASSSARWPPNGAPRPRPRRWRRRRDLRDPLAPAGGLF